ncbi:hypothetical protein [Tessaracoccus sp.]
MRNHPWNKRGRVVSGSHTEGLDALTARALDTARPVALDTEVC